MPDDQKKEPGFPDPSNLKYTIWEMQKDTYAFNFGGSVCMYLLVGDEKALLIDTAYGYGDIPGMIRKLTDQPVVVVNTHNHGDHTGGNAFFPEVHLFRPPFMMTSLPGGRPTTGLPYPRYRKIAIEDGHIFDLGGGREVEVITIPAHNESSIALLDRQHRLLFTGDELEAGQVLLFEDATAQLPAHLANMQKLWARRTEFDGLCPAHNGAPVNPDLIMDFIRLDESIIAGTPKLVDDPFFPKMLVMMKGDQLQGLRAEYGKASIVYAMPKMYEPGYAGHPQAKYIEQVLHHGGLSLAADGGFYPDKPITASGLADVINHLVPLYDGQAVQLPTGSAASDLVSRKDAYVLLAMALGLEGVMGWPSFMPGGFGAKNDLHKNAAAAMQRYNATLYGQDPDAWLTRADAAQIAAMLAYKAKMLELFEPGQYRKDGMTMGYRFFSPNRSEENKKYPLILFLHGGGEIGTDNKFQLTANDGASVWVDRHLHGDEPACFVLAPQAFPAPGRMGWSEEQCRMVNELIEKLAAEYPIDTKKICCTGMSMGGRGTWTFNRLFPDRCACMVGICGTYAFDLHEIDQQAGDVVGKLKNKPIWIFHAEDDVVVDINLSRRVVELFRQAGSNIRYTEYPASAGYNHGSWVPAYEDAEMRRWVHEQLVD